MSTREHDAASSPEADIVEQWRKANDWPGLVWSPQNLSDEPRWLAAWADLETRIAAALTKAIADERRESDEDFLKLVRQLAEMNTTVPNLVEAIVEDIGYGAHRVDRDYKREQGIRRDDTADTETGES